MSMNLNYYNQNAQEFFDNTVEVDMSSLYQAFEAHLPKHADVVDAGCGSGRDTSYFLSQGYNVTSFDASEEMVKLASEHTDHPISHSTFLDFQLPPESQHGIWACATLLHVPQNDLEKTFAHLATWLKPNGILYCSFKYGDGEVERGGRQFTNLTESSLKQVISGLELKAKELWVTHDLRAGRADEKWLNAILVK